MTVLASKTIELKNSKKLTIRSPEREDALKLIEFVKQVSIDSKYILISDGEFSMTVEQEADWILSAIEDPGAIILIGEIDSRVVAITNAKNGNRKRNSHVAHLGTSVDKKFRGQGIGKMMMEELLVWAKNHRGIEYLELSVMGDNAIAQNLYKSIGFESVGEVPDAYKYEDGSYQNNIIMRLRTTD